MTNDEMLERLGSQATLELIHKNYDGKDLDFILNDLNYFLGHEEDNPKLAEKIWDVCS